MKNRFIAALTAAAVVLSCAGTLGGCSQGLEYTLSDDGAYYTVTDAKNVAGEIVIPDTYKGIPVTQIGDWAFYDCENITSAVIPNGVTVIGSYAFCGCTSLEQVNIPDSVTEIKESAFVRCSSLVEVVIPDSVTYIGYGAFQTCGALERVTLSDNLTNIGGSLFYLSDNVKYNIYGNAKYIGSSQNSYLLLYSAASANITSCDIHGETRFINDYAFSNCTALTEIAIGRYITQTGYWAFNGCTALKKVYLGEGVTEISAGSFTGCTALEEIDIPDGVKIIDGEAFSGCSSLASINIPDSVEQIGEDAFESCERLATASGGISYVGGWVIACENTVTEAVLPEGTRGIADSAFVNITYGSAITFDVSVGYVYIPASVKHIGGNAFEGCPLTTAVFEDPDGWSVYNYYTEEVIAVSADILSDEGSAAKCLTSTYCYVYRWHKNR